MQSVTPLEPGHAYHIYNRGNNGENIFVEPRNYRYFLHLYAKHVEPIATTYAFCLLRNHFHLFVRICETDGASGKLLDSCSARQHFANLFNAYAKAINKAYQRSGSLFQEHFGRIEVTSETYFAILIRYIHRNPQKHGFVTDFRDYPYSSYHVFLGDRPTRLPRAEVLEWFGNRTRFARLHDTDDEMQPIAHLIAEGFD